MNTKNLPPEFAALLSSIAGITSASFIEIKQREGQSIEDAIAEAEAEHRKECAECAAEHAAEEAARVAEKMRAALAEKQRAEVDALNEKQRAEVARAEGSATPEADTRATGASKAFGMPYGENTAGGITRKPVGYMMFVRKPDDAESVRAMPMSFRPTEKAVEELVAKFKQTGTYIMLNMLGSTPIITIRPVYAD